MRPIVHIGYHKTATTWFQRSVYPHATTHRWIERARVQAALLDPSGMAFDPLLARAMLSAGDDGRPALLCEENLSGYIHNGGLHGFLPPAVAGRIKQVLPDARIVIFVRSQVSMIAACYRQYVRGGGTHGVHRYLFPSLHLRGAYAQPFKVPRFAFDHFDYGRLVVLYDDLFGRENVHVYPFEDLADPNEVLARMEKDLALSLDRERVRFDRPNASWDDALLPAARFLNRFTRRTVEDKDAVVHVPGFYLARSGLLSAFSGILPRGKRRPLLGADLQRWIERRFAASNARLHGLRPRLLPEGFYPAAQPADAPPPFSGAPERPPGTALMLVKWLLYALALLLMIAGAATFVRIVLG